MEQNEKRTYQAPQAEVIVQDFEDIIVASGDTSGGIGPGIVLPDHPLD